MEWLQDAEDFSSSPGSLAGDESGSEIDELPLHHRHHNETPTPSFDSPEVLASYVGSPIREHHGQGLAFFDAADCPQTDDDFIDDEDSDPEDGDDSDTPTDVQSSAIAEIFRCFICLGKVGLHLLLRPSIVLDVSYISLPRIGMDVAIVLVTH
jgi:hypothetical protein